MGCVWKHSHSGNWWSRVRDTTAVKENLSQFSLLSKRLLKIYWFYSFWSLCNLCSVSWVHCLISQACIWQCLFSKLDVKCVIGWVKCAVLYIKWSIVTVSILMFNNLYDIFLSWFLIEGEDYVFCSIDVLVVEFFLT